MTRQPIPSSPFGFRTCKCHSSPRPCACSRPRHGESQLPDCHVEYLVSCVTPIPRESGRGSRGRVTYGGAATLYRRAAARLWAERKPLRPAGRWAGTVPVERCSGTRGLAHPCQADGPAVGGCPARRRFRGGRSGGWRPEPTARQGRPGPAPTCQPRRVRPPPPAWPGTRSRRARPQPGAATATASPTRSTCSRETRAVTTRSTSSSRSMSGGGQPGAGG